MSDFTYFMPEIHKASLSTQDSKRILVIMEFLHGGGGVLKKLIATQRGDNLKKVEKHWASA